jgi:hypothetical protein
MVIPTVTEIPLPPHAMEHDTFADALPLVDPQHTVAAVLALPRRDRPSLAIAA